MPDELTLYEYGRLAIKTASKETLDGWDATITCAALGLTGEAGEFADRVKKLLFHGHLLTQEEKDALRKEVGDILWYCNLAAVGLDTTLEWIARDNIEKLRLRYPEGFDSESSKRRYVKE